MSTEMTNKNSNSFEMEIDKPLTVQIQDSSSAKNSSLYSWFQRLFTLDGTKNQKHHRPIFIITMSIFHVFIYLLVSASIHWRHSKLIDTLVNLGAFYLPCVHPTSKEIRTRIIRCSPQIKHGTCSYDDILKCACFSFLYPHQIWRFFTVNLLHIAWLHLLSNVLIQLVEGIPLERKYGSFRIIILYWISGVGAILCFSLKIRELPANGASGSLYGLIFFLTIDRLIAIRTNMEHRRFNIVQLIFLLLPLCITSLPLMINHNVAHSGHVGGGLVGLLFGIGMLGCPWSSDSEQCINRTVCRWIAIVLLIVYFLVVVSLVFLEDAPVVYSILYNSSSSFDWN